MQKKRVFLHGYRRSVTRIWRSAYEQYACAHHEAADEEEFIVSREFSGNQSMREAFEQLIERQSHSHFEEWLEKKAG